MTIPQTIMEEARRLLREGNCVACIDDMHCSCFEPLCEALLAAEQRGAERERARGRSQREHELQQRYGQMIGIEAITDEELTRLEESAHRHEDRLHAESSLRNTKN